MSISLLRELQKKVKRMLTAVNVNRVFTQSLMLILFYFIEVIKTSFLNILTQ